MKTQTKTYTVLGYLMIEDRRKLGLFCEFKVNTVNQAKQRFLKKYNDILMGRWEFEILDQEDELLHVFENTDQHKLDLDNNKSTSFNALINGVRRLIKTW